MLGRLRLVGPKNAWLSGQDWKKLVCNGYRRGLLGAAPLGLSRGLSSSSSEGMKAVQEVPHPDGLTRWPGISSPQALLRTFDWAGTVSFAASGCLTAGHMGLDILGCTVVGSITALGGGTIRDCMLSQRVFWMDEYEYIFLCLATCAATLAAWKALEDEDIVREDASWFWWSDTLGIGAFCCIGAQNAIRLNLHPIVCILCGMMTSTFGGVTRDTLTKRDVRILHSKSEIYATTALSGSTMYMLARGLGASPAVKILCGASTAVAMRYAAAHKDIKLPLAPWNSEAWDDTRTSKEGHRD